MRTNSKWIGRGTGSSSGPFQTLAALRLGRGSRCGSGPNQFDCSRTTDSEAARFHCVGSSSYQLAWFEFGSTAPTLEPCASMFRLMQALWKGLSVHCCFFLWSEAWLFFIGSSHHQTKIVFFCPFPSRGTITLCCSARFRLDPVLFCSIWSFCSTFDFSKPQTFNWKMARFARFFFTCVFLQCVCDDFNGLRYQRQSSKQKPTISRFGPFELVVQRLNRFRSVLRGDHIEMWLQPKCAVSTATWCRTPSKSNFNHHSHYDWLFKKSIKA